MRFYHPAKPLSGRTSFEENGTPDAIGGTVGARGPEPGGISAELLNELSDRADREIFSSDGELLKSYPVGCYLSFFRALPEYAPYRLVPEAARTFCEAIEARGGRNALEAYHRLAMIRLIADDAPGSGRRLTPEAGKLLGEYLRRVLRNMESPRNGFYLHSHDQFAKDFAVCRGKLLPCGVELIDPCSGVPRRALLNGDVRQFLSSAGYLLAKAGGFRPFWELHFDRRSMQAFNERGYAELYLRIADMLALNPNIRGIMSSSWWHDPQIATISPELAFIDRHPKEGGARLLFVEENPTASADATRFSTRRMALQATGAYRPRVYLLVWARQEILAWARNYRSAR